jgi:FixJ family two-component response regulator
MSNALSEIKSPLVIVIDGDPAVLNSLKFSLEIEGFRVRTFASATELLNSDDLPRSGCLLIDFSPRGIDGFDLLRQVRARNIASPAIFITTHPTAALRKRAATAGVPIVEKPMFGNALIDRVRGVLTCGQPDIA